jgi:Protein of unknown function (DUF3618)
MADRARDPETIEREIERTRDDLARSIDLLADRLSPKRAAGRGFAKARVEAGHIADDVGAFIGREPREDGRSSFTGPVLVGAGLVVTAIAAGMLLRRWRR